MIIHGGVKKTASFDYSLIRGRVKIMIIREGVKKGKGNRFVE